MGACQGLREHFRRGVPVVRSARPGVEAVGDAIEFFLAEDAEVCALWQVLPNQAVGVLASATLARAVRVAEVDLHAWLRGQVNVSRHLTVNAAEAGGWPSGPSFTTSKWWWTLGASWIWVRASLSCVASAVRFWADNCSNRSLICWRETIKRSRRRLGAQQKANVSEQGGLDTPAFRSMTFALS